MTVATKQPKPKFVAARAVDLGGFGTAKDGSDVVRHFDKGDAIPNPEKYDTLLGLVASGYLSPANDSAIEHLAKLQKRAEG